MGAVVALFTGFGLSGYLFLLLLYIAFLHPRYFFLPLVALGLLYPDSLVFFLGTYSSVGILYLMQKLSPPVPRISKWFFYLFYPLHLSVLLMIKAFFSIGFSISF
jgi:hypothetical protein